MMERWVVQTIMNLLKNSVSEAVSFPGMRVDPDTENYYTLQVRASVPGRTRRGQIDNQYITVIGCHSRVEEEDAVRDIMAPWKLAEAAKALYHQVDLEIFDLETETKIGCLNCNEVSMEHLKHNNMVFGGEGDFAIDERLFHTVVVTFTATMVQYPRRSRWQNAT